MKSIGFIGLGNMGLPMALNLTRAGHQLTGYDLSPQAREVAEAAGLTIAESAQDAADDKDVIVTMLPDGDAVIAVAKEIAPAVRAGAMALDCSTIDVEQARKFHVLASNAKLSGIDAPVSGGIGGAKAATLTFMAGGEAGVVQGAAPLFEVMGAKWVHCGQAGAGQAAKICNNMILGISMIGVCEAFNLADAMGLDRQAMFDVTSASSGSCWSINSYCPAPGIGPDSPADHDYHPGFSAALMLKDLKLGQGEAERANCATPMGQRATEIYDAFVSAGGGDKDFSAMINELAKSKR